MRNAKLFFLIPLLALAPAANAQCNLNPSDPIRQVMGPVCRQRAELDGYWTTRAILAEAGSWVSELGDHARYARGAARAATEHGGYDEYGQPVGRRGMSRTHGAILGGSLGANIGTIASRGSGKWMGIGAGGGALVGALLAGRGDHPVAGQPLFFLVNQTGAVVEVRFVSGKKCEEKKVGILGAGNEWPLDGRRLKIPTPNTCEGYVGYANLENQDGGLTSDRIVPKGVRGGWIFVEPPEAGGR